MNPYWYYQSKYKAMEPYSEYIDENNENKMRNKLLRPCIIEEAYCDYFDLGDPAPNFTLEGVLNGEKIKTSLNDFKGKWRVIFFYGSDFTFVWPTELAAVAEKYDKFKALDTVVLAISTDSIYSHKIFTQTSPSGRKINYPLLSDRTQAVSKTYGILNEKEGFAYRATFIVDPEGTIQAWSVNPQPVGRNIDEILRIIEGLQFNRKTGLGAPAGWEPGDQGIKLGWQYVGKY